MIRRKAPSRLEKSIGLAVCALLLSSSARAPRAAAQEIRIERVGLTAPIGGAAAASPGGVSFPGAGPSLSASPVVLAAPFAAPLGFAPSAVEPAAVPAAGAATREIQAAAVSAAAAAPAAARARIVAEGVKTPSPSSRTSVQEVGRRAAAGQVMGRALESAAVPAAGVEGPSSSEMDRESAQRDFSALLGERLAAGDPGASAPSAALESRSVSALPSRLSAPARSRARLLSGIPAALAFSLHPGLRAVVRPSLATWHALSQAGYVAGNIGAAIFPLVQIYETFHGKPTPRIRAIVGAAASLALGLISAPILHKTLWGVQNIFGGMTLLVPLLIGARARGVRGSGLKETALISLTAMALSAGVYFAAATAVPAALAAVFSAAAIAKIALVVQFTTSAMFLWMFLPDVVKVLRGKAAGGFSPGFNLMFFLSAVGSMIWAAPSAWIFSDAHQGTYRLIFAVNAIYALASFVSFWFARREAKPG